MFELIYSLPEQLRAAWRLSETIALKRLRPPRNVVVAGMGGSGIGGELLRALLWTRSPLPVLVVKDYSLPAAVDATSLCFIVSFSGNTEETISCYEAAQVRRATVIAVTSGGRIRELAQARRDILIPVVAPAGCPPRAAIGHLFVPLAVTLSRFRLIPDLRPELKETIRVLQQQRNRFRVRARRIARELKEHIPVIYSTSPLLDPVANRWRAQFNENSKVFAHVNSFPELDHNEIVGFGQPRAFARVAYLLVLSDPSARERSVLRQELTLELLRPDYAEARVLVPEGRSDLARAFSLILFGDLLSYYLAIERKVDPLPVRRIDLLKQRLAAGR
ncbi:MAG: bifunctional phosphoglucose/phosphomannose isomerase [candidate division WOR-3 bacterium]